MSTIDQHETALLQIETGVAEGGKNVETDELPGNVIMVQADNRFRLRQSVLGGGRQPAPAGPQGRSRERRAAKGGWDAFPHQFAYLPPNMALFFGQPHVLVLMGRARA